MASLRYPLMADKGKLVTTEDFPRITGDRIKSAVLTYWEERVYQPDHGIQDPSFKSINDLPSVLADVRRSVSQVLETTPEVTFDVLGSITDDGQLYLYIPYVYPDTPEIQVEVTLGA